MFGKFPIKMNCMLPTEQHTVADVYGFYNNEEGKLCALCWISEFEYWLLVPLDHVSPVETKLLNE